MDSYFGLVRSHHNFSNKQARSLPLKTCQFQFKMGLSLGKNVRSFNQKMHLLRFSTIVNAQTVYHKYVTNKKRNKHFRVIYTLQGCRDWLRAVFCHTALQIAKYIVTSQMTLPNKSTFKSPIFFFNLSGKSNVRRTVIFFPGFVKNFKP